MLCFTATMSVPLGERCVPRGTHKLLTLFKTARHVTPGTCQQRLCVQHPRTKPCVVTHHSYPADRGSSNDLAITGPDRFLPTNKHSLSSLKIEIFLTARQSQCQHQNRTSPQSASRLKIFFSRFLSGIKHSLGNLLELFVLFRGAQGCWCFISMVALLNGNIWFSVRFWGYFFLLHFPAVLTQVRRQSATCESEVSKRLKS